MKYNLVTILGPTASGKTAVAANLAYKLNSEVISADSRQVYRGMNLGTGKDYADYIINEQNIPYHLIDIADAGYKYNVYEFQNDFVKIFKKLTNEGKLPVLCGGTGLYLEAVLRNYKLLPVPENTLLRAQLELKSDAELAIMLEKMKKLHNTTEICDRARLVRAIEIEKYYEEHPSEIPEYPEINSLLIGVKFDRLSQRKRITQRLHERLNAGMIDEVKNLLVSGVPQDTLLYYGLEYKFITLYLINQLSYNEMFEKLNTAIHQFMKRQMTWFRKMERDGMKIYWLDGYAPLTEKLDRILSLLNG